MISTTVLCVRHRGGVAIGADGQVTLNATVMKHTAKKTRRLFNDRCLAGFAGATADAVGRVMAALTRVRIRAGNPVVRAEPIQRTRRIGNGLARSFAEGPPAAILLRPVGFE